MYYLAWIISAGLAVTVGCFVATRLEKRRSISIKITI